jgi:hypothetical protein
MKLATIQEIKNLEPIEGADAIEKATILGWQVVVKKGEFKIGQHCCYIQIDTICPEIPFFEFLRECKFRVKTRKFRKCISQGLAIPLDSLECFKEQFTPGIGYFWNIDDDVTELVGIKKYEKTVEIAEEYVPVYKPKTWYGKFLYKYFYRYFPKKRYKTNFPTEIVSKTDEERIQNHPNYLEKYKGKKFYPTEKLNGSSITIICERKKKFLFSKLNFRVCSRNLEIHNTENEWYKVFTDSNLKTSLSELMQFNKRINLIVLQGEYIGKPQGNPYKLEKNEIRIFNVFVDGRKYSPQELNDVCRIYDIPRCPELPTMVLNHTMEELILMAEGKSVLNKNTEREGLVFRNEENTISFKVISNKFLLKNDE